MFSPLSGEDSDDITKEVLLIENLLFQLSDRHISLRAK